MRNRNTRNRGGRRNNSRNSRNTRASFAPAPTRRNYRGPSPRSNENANVRLPPLTRDGYVNPFGVSSNGGNSLNANTQPEVLQNAYRGPVFVPEHLNSRNIEEFEAQWGEVGKVPGPLMLMALFFPMCFPNNISMHIIETENPVLIAVSFPLIAIATILVFWWLYLLCAYVFGIRRFIKEHFPYNHVEPKHVLKMRQAVRENIGYDPMTFIKDSWIYKLLAKIDFSSFKFPSSSNSSSSNSSERPLSHGTMNEEDAQKRSEEIVAKITDLKDREAEMAFIRSCENKINFSSGS